MRHVLMLLTVSGLALLAGPSTGHAAERSAGKLFHVLSEHGDVSTEAKAQATLDKLAKKLISSGGGTIMVTAALPQHFKLHNLYQSTRDEVSVTIIDVRDGRLTILPPPIGFDSRGAWAGHRIKRTLNLKGKSLGHWTTVAAAHIENNVVAGTISYGQRTLFPVKKGKNVRIYPASIEGLWVGARVNLSGDGQTKIKSIGWDRKRRKYFITADLKSDHPAGEGMGNKHLTPGLLLDHHFNSDNQTFALDSRTYQYGVGDSFCVSGTHLYQGNIFSGAGDEGAVCLNAETIHDLDSFRAQVESFDPKTGVLIYKPGNTRTRKLSMSRPLVNLNPKKWITGGHVVIVRPDDWSGWLEDSKGGYTDWTGKVPMTPKYKYKGESYPSLLTKQGNVLGGLIEGSKDAPWDENVVGRYFAVDEDTEKYKPGELPGGYWPCPPKNDVRRWYRITAFKRHKDGTKSIRILRIRWAAVSAGSPTLFREDNYTQDGHVRPLKYIIAPGGPVTDISEGWVDTRRAGIVYHTLKSDSRKLKIAPNGDRGTRFDFEPDDPVVQAVGPDPWMPRPIRIRMFDEFPSSMASPAIEIRNNGFISHSDGVQFISNARYLDDVAKRKDRKPAFMNGVNFESSVGVGMRFGGYVQTAAMLMEQRAGNAQPITWLHQGKSGRTSIGVNPTDGTLTVTGGPVDLARSSLRNAQLTQTPGISGTAVAANNLRGIDAQVRAGRKGLSITFPTPEPDAKYAVTVQPNWNTRDWIARKAATGFTVQFSEPAPANAAIDWHLIR